MDKFLIESSYGEAPPEGVIYRYYSEGKFNFAAKYVRDDCKNGIYLENISGHLDVWNWRPDMINAT